MSSLIYNESRLIKSIRRQERETVVDVYPAKKSKHSFLAQWDPSPLDSDFEGDVSLIVEDGEAIQAHRFVLAGKSPVFKNMLKVDMKEKMSGEIHITGFSTDVVRAVRDCLYTANIVFSDDVTSLDVLRFAHQYDISWLKEQCDHTLAKSISEENVSEMIFISYRYGTERLKKESKKFFREHPEIQDEAWDTMFELA